MLKLSIATFQQHLCQCLRQWSHQFDISGNTNDLLHFHTLSGELTAEREEERCASNIFLTWATFWSGLFLTCRSILQPLWRATSSKLLLLKLPVVFQFNRSFLFYVSFICGCFYLWDFSQCKFVFFFKTTKIIALSCIVKTKIVLLSGQN